MVNSRHTIRTLSYFLVSLLAHLFLLLSPNALTATEYSDSCGKEWDWSNPLPTGSWLNDIAWSEELKIYVAVGAGGAILNSSDGVTWSDVSIDNKTINFNAITWTGENFYTAASPNGGSQGALYSSNDGVNWQSQVINTKYNYSLSDVIWVNNKLVVLGKRSDLLKNTVLLMSDDGSTWNEITFEDGSISGSLDDNGFYVDSVNIVPNSISVANNRWIVIGNSTNWPATPRTSYIYTSEDGIHWQTSKILQGEVLTGIAWIGEKFVVTGNSYSEKDNPYSNTGILYSSHDGGAWEKDEIGNNGINGIFSDGKNLVLLSNPVYLSQDGSNWQEIMLPSINQGSHTHSISLQSMTKGDKWIGVGERMLTSQDLINWDEITLGLYGDFNDIIWTGNKFIASGGGSAVYSSFDGLRWEISSSETESSDGTITGGMSEINSVAWSGERYVAVGPNISDYAIVYTSEDGLTWNSSVLSYQQNVPNMHSVIWSGEQFVIVGSPDYDWRTDTYSGESAVYISPDGINWTRQKSGTSIHLYDVVWTGEFYIAVGSNLSNNDYKKIRRETEGVILKSTNGKSWTEISSTENFPSLYAITWSGEEFIAVGGNYNAYILSSKDGITWDYRYNEPILTALLDVIWNGEKYITLGVLGRALISNDGKYWEQLSINSSNNLTSIAWNKKKFVLVGDMSTILTSECYPKQSSNNTRALIIAGGGNPNDPLQDATNENANLAYHTLRQRGISADNIRYYNAIPQDADKDGVIDTVSGTPSAADIKHSITTWLANNTNSEIPVLIYLIDHGGSNLFYLNKPANDYAEVITADEVTEWLNTLQDKTSARVTMVYDACHSGSFMDELKQSPTQDYDRTLLFSSAPDQLAYMGAKGGLSFSNFFWNNIGQGMDVRTAHRSATVAVRATTQNDGKEYQTTLIDDNGDGEENYVDGSLARDTYLGVDNNDTVVYPQIVKHQGSTTLDSADAGQVNMFARVDMDKSQIARVWAIVIPPDSKTTGSEAVTELPVIELDNYDAVSGEYRASTDTSTIFNQSGQYTVSYYAKTKAGVNSRFPVVSLITVTDSGYQALDQSNIQAIIIGGSDNNAPSFKLAIKNNTNLAYRILRARGVNAENIYYLSSSTQDADSDGHNDTQGISSTSAYQAAINWAKGRINAQTPLLIYVMGYGEDQTLSLNATDTLTAESLAQDLNTLQSSTGARITTIIDAPQSGSFMAILKPPTGTDYERINLFSTESDAGAYYGAEGQLSFSYYFWSHTNRGLNVYQAYRNTHNALTTATRRGSQTRYQQPQLDDNGDGVSQKDGNLAKVTYLGLNAATASTFPVVFAHQGDTATTPNTSITLTAKVDLPTDYIEKVWALINPPSQGIDNVSLITDLPQVDLTYAAATRSYTGTTPSLTESGDYTISYYAQSKQGNVSEPLTATIQVNDSGTLSLSQCAFVDSSLNLTLPCVFYAGQGYQAGLTLASNTPHHHPYVWQLDSLTQDNTLTQTNHCTTVDEALNLAIQCVEVSNSQYQAILNFAPANDTLYWTLGEVR